MESGGAEGEGGEGGRAAVTRSSSLRVVVWSEASGVEWWLLLCSRACMTEFETEMEMKEERSAAAGHGHMGRAKVPPPPLNDEPMICRYWKESVASRDTLE